MYVYVYIYTYIIYIYIYVIIYIYIYIYIYIHILHTWCIHVSPLNPQSGASPIHRCAWSYDFDGCLDSTSSGSAERSDQRSVQDCLGAGGKFREIHGKIHYFNIHKIIYKWKNVGLKWIVKQAPFENGGWELGKSWMIRGLSSHGPRSWWHRRVTLSFFGRLGKLMELYYIVPTSTSQN